MIESTVRLEFSWVRSFPCYRCVHGRQPPPTFSYNKTYVTSTKRCLVDVKKLNTSTKHTKSIEILFPGKDMVEIGFKLDDTFEFDEYGYTGDSGGTHYLCDVHVISGYAFSHIMKTINFACLVDVFDFLTSTKRRLLHLFSFLIKIWRTARSVYKQILGILRWK